MHSVQKSAAISWCHNMLKEDRFSVVCWAMAILLFSSTAVSQTPSVDTSTTTTATATVPKPFSNFIPTLTRKPSNTPNMTPSASASGSATTATHKTANTGDIFRWIDSKGKVQYSTDVPEDRRSTAKKIDTRSNVVSSQVPVTVQGEPQYRRPSVAPPAAAASTARQPITEQERCEAAWQAYRAAEQCFAQYRSASRAGSRISEDALQNCQTLPEPRACR